MTEPFKRDLSNLETWEESSHKSYLDYSLATDAATIFAANTSCILTPEVTVGPYYVSGELIRSDVVEDQAGVRPYRHSILDSLLIKIGCLAS
jgi:hypothetical protein